MTLNLADISIETLLEASSKDLQDFQAKLSAAIEQRKEKDKSDLRAKMEALASEHGVLLDDFLANPPKKIKAAKYKNPANSRQVWAGRGRKPNWLLELLNAGRNLEEFKA